MALDESFDDEKDHVEETDGLNIVFEKKLSVHLQGKVIDYQTGDHGGFAIYNENQAGGCDSAGDCDPSGGCGDGCCH